MGEKEGKLPTLEQIHKAKEGGIILKKDKEGKIFDKSKVEENLLFLSSWSNSSKLSIYSWIDLILNLLSLTSSRTKLLNRLSRLWYQTLSSGL